MRKLNLCFYTFLLTLSTQAAYSQDSKENIKLQKKKVQDIVRIIEYKENKIPLNLPYSANNITSNYIKEHKYVDAERTLVALPGVNVRSEDGFGLRPNIGIRASRMGRSANITLMEDGTLIAPAPYSEPEAYYFPETLRMMDYEVYKGGSSVQYGPVTTSGVLNMVTHQIDGKSFITTSFGSFGEKILNTKISKKNENAGFVFVGTDKKSDGFRKIDLTDKSAGYHQSDYMLKASINTDKDSTIYQQLDLKIAQQNHDSDQSYLGLTKDDFYANPERQYASSQLDNMKSKFKQAELKHTLSVADFSVITKAYRHTLERNWFRLTGVGSGLTSGNASYTSLTPGLIGLSSTQLGILQGSIDGDVRINDNKRSYVSQGIQTDVNYKIKQNNIAHSIDTGLRLHSDHEDRLQPIYNYNMIDGKMYFDSDNSTSLKDGNNRKRSANALSGYIKDTIVVGNLTIVPGVRYEHINLKNQQWADANRTTYSSSPSSFSNQKRNLSIVLPSLSSSYVISENISVFGGVHKGFAPATPGSQADNETSTNYEVGYRAKSYDEKASFEIVSYFNDYKNLLGSDNSSGGGVGNGSQYNGGKVKAYGVEILAGRVFSLKNVEFPTSISYTYTDAKFANSFLQNGVAEWGNVTKGDRLPYISRDQFTLNTGVKYGKVRTNILTRFVGSSYAKADGTLKVPSYMVFDATAHYQLNKNLTGFVSIYNIANKTYITSYHPSGVRGSQPRALRVGATFEF